MSVFIKVLFNPYKSLRNKVENIGHHFVGNVYVKFTSEDFKETWLN